jgi:hypothetical protein
MYSFRAAAAEELYSVVIYYALSMKVKMKPANTTEQRLENVEYAIASQRIEGLTVPPETVEDMRRVARGEMTTDEARAALFRRLECR